MKTLLWIDDNEKLIDAASPTFLEYGFLVIKATNATLALNIIRDQRLHGVLLDVHLPGGENGIELIDHIHKLNPALKVAIFTGYPENDESVKALMKGASAYLTKIRKQFPLDSEKQRRFFQALNDVFPEQDSVHPTRGETRRSSNSKPEPIKPSLWSSGIFIIALFVVVVLLVILLANTISPLVFPIAVVAILLLLAGLGALVLRVLTGEGLSESGMLTMFEGIFRNLFRLRGAKSESTQSNSHESEGEKFQPK